MKRDNFKVDYSLACADINCRPSFQYVYFKDGNIYASNTMVLVRCPISLHKIMNPHFLEGKFIHMDVFSAILSFPSIIPFENGIQCYNAEGRPIALYYYSDNIKTYPSCDKVIDAAIKEPSSKTADLKLDIENISIVSKLLHNPDGDVIVKCKSNLTNIVSPACDGLIGEQVVLFMSKHICDGEF